MTSSGSSQKIHEFMMCLEDDSSILIPVESTPGSFKLTQLSESVPRLFCDFPLVGSEFLALPFVTNSSIFHPTEPRDGVFLNSDTKKARFNKDIFSHAVSSYIRLIEVAAQQQWDDLYLLANIKTPESRDWLSESWYKGRVLEPILQKLYSTKIVRLSDGSMASLKSPSFSVDIPFHKRPEVRKAIWELVKDIAFFNVPDCLHLNAWYEIFRDDVWDANQRLTLVTLSEYIAKTQNLSMLAQAFQIDDPIDFLNRYFDVIELAASGSSQLSNTADFLSQQELAIIPNQEGVFCTCENLQQDREIDECLKVIAKDLHSNLYAKLAHRSISIVVQLPEKTRRSVIDGINSALKSDKIEHIKKKLACYRLTALFPTPETKNSDARKLIYDVSKKVFEDSIPISTAIQIKGDRLWEASDPIQLEAIVESISSNETLYKLSSRYDEEEGKTCTWLASLVSYLSQSDYVPLLAKYPIIPNQNSSFCKPEALFYEPEPIDELLKDIAAELRRDFRDELIDPRFVLDIPPSRSVDSKTVAGVIDKAVYPRLAENPRQEETQAIFNKIILWMDEYPNAEFVSEIFGDLAENRHKLYDDRKIAENLRKVAKLEGEVVQLSQENSNLRTANQELETKNQELETKNQALEATVEQLEQKLKAIEKVPEADKVQHEVDQDFLLTYGVTTADRLAKLLRETEFKNHYIRSQDELIARLQYVQKIIQRAKNNVRYYLSDHPDYDCSGWMEVSETVIGGVLKRGRKLSLVVRPSDNHKVTFYYSEEKDALEHSEAELWVENGSHQPHQITLGMVLKLQSIDEIKL